MHFATVQELVQTVMNEIPKPYGPDIIDQVFQRIESNPEWLEAYDAFVKFNGKFEAQNSVGFNVMGLAGMKSLDQVQPAKSGLIENYTELENA